MNSSPDPAFKALAAEQALADSTLPPAKAELAADWQLKQELGKLGTPPLPPGIRAQVLTRARQRRHPAWWAGLAAAITLTLGVGLIHQAYEQTPRQGAEPITISDKDLQQLYLALSTLEHSVVRARKATGRELASSLTLPNISLEQLPYGQSLRQWNRPGHPSEP